MFSLAVLVIGLCLFLSFSGVRGQDQPIPFVDDPTRPSLAKPLSRCPPLPEQAPEGTVVVYVAKTEAKPGFVCVRAVSGIRPSIGFVKFHWQREDAGHFQDFTEPLHPAPGLFIGEAAVHIGLWPNHWLDRQFPVQDPAPPGAYRACFRYTLYMSAEEQEACSEEFSFP